MAAGFPHRRRQHFIRSTGVLSVGASSRAAAAVSRAQLDEAVSRQVAPVAAVFRDAPIRHDLAVQLHAAERCRTAGKRALDARWSIRMSMDGTTCSARGADEGSNG
jgi:hypothetical protein